MKDVKTAWQKEWDRIESKEEGYRKKRQVRKESLFTVKIDEKVPMKAQLNLEKAFAKAFVLVFDKGTAIIEKTYKKEELERNFKVNEFAANLHEDKKSLNACAKKVSTANVVNLFISGVEGFGLGILGIGIPDIPLFLGVLLKGIYETALHYGYSYDTTEEQYFILKLIEAACAYGQNFQDSDALVDDYIKNNSIPNDFIRKEQIMATSASISKEMIYTKFVQGIPLIGAVGGAYDSIYVNRILSYAKLKYQKRFLIDRRKKK